MSVSHVRYRLEGESLAAAKIARDFYDKNARWPADRSAQAAAFMAAHPAEAALLGLNSPVVQAGMCGEYVRAYKTFPALYYAHDENFYLDCPVAHDGRHFKPKDGKRLTAKQSQSAQYQFSAGMGENIAPILHIFPEGVAAPKKARHLSEEVDCNGRALPIDMWATSYVHIYAPDARIRAVKKEFDREFAAFRKAETALVSAVSDIVATLKPQIEKRMEEKGDITHRIRYDDNEGCLLVSFNNKAYLPDHPALEIKDGSGNVLFKVRPNLATAKGRKLAKLFNAVGKKPDLSEKLGLPKAARADFEDIDGKTLLVTQQPLPGYAELREKAWLMRDGQDKDYGIKLPPRPF